MRDIPDDWRLHAARGVALAGLGRRDAALREAAWLQRSVVYREDAYDGPSRVGPARTRILAQAGEADAALDEIERILSRPAWFSIQMLRLDPLFDPLREHPRYQALLVKYGSLHGAERAKRRWAGISSGCFEEHVKPRCDRRSRARAPPDRPALRAPRAPPARSTQGQPFGGQQPLPVWKLIPGVHPATVPAAATAARAARMLCHVQLVPGTSS
jgi:hypothetical protein